MTISGLPGSASELVGIDVARRIGSRFIDAEIAARMCRRLRCSVAELSELEQSCLSVWGRLLRAIALPVEWPATYEVGYQWFAPETFGRYGLAEHHITKKQYLDALASVIRKLVAEGNVVIHGHASPLFIPPDAQVLNVFLSASDSSRRQRIAVEREVGQKEAETLLKRLDRDAITINKNLYGFELLDMGLYDLTVNLDSLPLEGAVQTIVGALQLRTPTIGRLEDDPTQLSPIIR